MKLSIAIIEDNHSDIKTLSNILLNWAGDRNHLLAVEQFDSSASLQSSGSVKFDMLFIDVMLPDILGTDLTRKLKEVTPDNALFVLMSSEHSYMKAGYGIEAFDFLCKPFDEADIFEVMERAVNRLNVNRKDKYTFKSKGVIYSIPLTDILFIEVSRNYATLHTHKATYRFRHTVSSLLEELPSYFVQSSSNTIVNIMRAASISSQAVTFEDYDHKAAISKPHFNKVKQSFCNN